MLLTCFVPQAARTYLPFGTDDCLPSRTVVFLMEVGPSNTSMLIPVKCDVGGRVYAGCGDGIHVWGEFRCPLQIPATDR